ncbi:malonyl CoA-acyl carrier protein transacylase [Anopheles sinensis]|uniref:Malonyl CoA-acyl carrier protein transacylase n=1 Tax=Anopheles sinensis TaxID=74873 RepID=A0A084WLU2_ANOSI|nr:malonyl CoA-acyl carrier protein transacylase [Anopheles sinensis]
MDGSERVLRAQTTVVKAAQIQNCRCFSGFPDDSLVLRHAIARIYRFESVRKSTRKRHTTVTPRFRTVRGEIVALLGVLWGPLSPTRRHHCGSTIRKWRARTRTPPGKEDLCRVVRLKVWPDVVPSSGQ